MMRSAPGRLIVLGDANPDLILTGADVSPEFGQVEKLVEQAALSLGGSAAITSAYAARLGVPTSLAAAIGTDLFGDFVESEVIAAGVETSSLVRVTQPTGISVTLSRGDDRAILTAPGAIDALAAELIVESGVLLDAAHVHVSSYFLQPALADTLPDLLAEARRAGATTSLDTNFDPMQRWLSQSLEAVLQMTDLFFPNRTEAAALSGRDDPAKAGRWLASRYGTAVAVKCGSAGAVLAYENEVLQAAPPAVRVVDTTGAGDAFNAGFLAAWLERLGWATCLRTGVAAGSLASTAVGAVFKLDRDAVFTLGGAIEDGARAPARNQVLEEQGSSGLPRPTTASEGCGEDPLGI
jgi:sugar/nucleoside kinase (ribokinase family)